jgi:6-phosphofructokinase 1
MQSGGSTPVFNRSLFGVVREASGHDTVGDIFGAAHGLDGLLSGRLIDLRKQSATEWGRIARTPGAALGSTRRKLKAEDIPAAMALLATRDIRWCFIIGGNDSAVTGHALHIESVAAGVPLSVLHVPKTIDNDLVATDHSPGYGSAARFVALAAMGAGRDAEAMGDASPVAIIEVMGRDAGWLAAAAALGKREERDAPHAICIPEVPVDEGQFLGLLEAAYRRFGFAVAVVAENARGADGVLGGEQEPWYVDDFGHAYYEGAGRHLAALVGRHLNVRVRYERPGSIQRSMAACVSGIDAREAELVGMAAVRYALGGATDSMVSLVRDDGDGYGCSTDIVPLGQVAGRTRSMPGEYLDRSALGVTDAFIEYARPLIGAPLPRFLRLSEPVEK